MFEVAEQFPDRLGFIPAGRKEIQRARRHSACATHVLIPERRRFTRHLLRHCQKSKGPSKGFSPAHLRTRLSVHGFAKAWKHEGLAYSAFSAAPENPNWPRALTRGQLAQHGAIRVRSHKRRLSRPRWDRPRRIILAEKAAEFDQAPPLWAHTRKINFHSREFRR